MSRVARAYAIWMGAAMALNAAALALFGVPGLLAGTPLYLLCGLAAARASGLSARHARNRG